MADKEATLLLKIKQTGQEVLDKTGSAITKIGAAAAATFTAISAFIAKGIAEYQKQEEAVNKLNQSLINQGIYTSKLSEDYQKLAEEMERKTLFGDEEIINAQATIQAYIGQEKVSKELIAATLDLAQAQGIDLDSAAKMVGKSIGTTTNALQKQVPGMKLSGDVSSRTAQIIEGLNQKFEGQAEAATKGTGSIKQLSNVISNFMEMVGKSAAPIVILLTNELKNMIQAANDATGFFSILKNLMMGFSVTVIYAQGLIEEFINGFSNLGKAIRTMSGLVENGWSATWEEVKKINQDGNNELVKIRERTNKKIQDLTDAVIDAEGLKIEEEKRMLDESNKKKVKATKAFVDQNKTLREEDRNQKTAENEAEDALEAERFAIKSEEELVRQQAHLALMKDDRARAQLEELNATIAAEKGKTAAIDAERKKSALITKFHRDAEEKSEILTNQRKLEAEKKFQQGRQETIMSSLQTISTMQNAHNKALMVVGKAAALAQIAISTAVGVMRAFEFLGPFAWPAAIAIGAAGAYQAAQVMGVQLAEGGIVKATAGGVPAVIGEGGKDEAVIPLEDGAAAMGTHITIVVNGGLLGDEVQARELAIALDKEMLKLRRANQSLAFDSSIV